MATVSAPTRSRRPARSPGEESGWASELVQLAPWLSSPLREAVSESVVWSDRTRLDHRESRLSRSGRPVEAAFVWPPGSFRLTVDPDSHAPPEVRYQTCRQEIDWIPTVHQNVLLESLLTRGAAQERRYGAWLGLRDEIAGSERTGFEQMQKRKLERKLYVEIPDAFPVARLESRTGRFTTGLEHRQVQPCMLGLASDGRSEVYCAVDKLTRQDLEDLTSGLGLPARSHELVELLEQLWRCRVDRLLPSDDLGFSVAFDAAGPTTLALYSTASALLGSDRQVREAVVDLASRRGWPAERYAGLSGPLHSFTGSSSYHGMVGFVAPGRQEIQFTVTVAPPGADL